VVKTLVDDLARRLRNLCTDYNKSSADQISTLEGYDGSDNMPALVAVLE